MEEETVTVEDDEDITIDALRPATVDIIAALLNPIKVIPTDDGFLPDWRGLADLIGIGGQYLPSISVEKNKTRKVLEMWKKKNTASYRIKNLLKFLEQLDRFDIIDDTKTSIAEDISIYRTLKARKEPGDLQVDWEVLTNDDVNNLNNGGSLQKYDAFVLFADADIEFATQLIDTLEKQYRLKLCVSERDFVGGTLKFEAGIRLITDRCNRLIVIVSASFLNSHAMKFFVNYAQAVGIEQKKRKVIPCLYEPCPIPAELGCYHLLDYKRLRDLRVDYWEKLYLSIVPQAASSLATNATAPYRSSPEKADSIDSNQDGSKKDVKFNQEVKVNGVVASPSSENLQPEQEEEKPKTKKWKRNFIKLPWKQWRTKMKKQNLKANVG